MSTLSSLSIVPAFAGLLALAGLCVAGGACRNRTQRKAPAPAGVGFELPGSASVVRGAVLTQPPGQEEAFLTHVASGATAWVAACRGETGTGAPVFSFETDARGAVRAAAADPGATPRDRCLAARAADGAAAGLPPGTRVTVQLALRGP
jgi:hypothetical protein